jgi:hypothetical protein
MDETTPALASPESLTEKNVTGNRTEGNTHEEETKETEKYETEANEKYETEETEKYETEETEKGDSKIVSSPAIKSVQNSSSTILSVENKNCYANVHLSLDDEIKVGDDASSFNNVGVAVDQNNTTSKRQQVREKIVFVRQRLKDVFEQHLSADHFVMPEEPTRWHRLQHGLLLPPHGPAGYFATFVLVVLTFWITWYSHPQNAY